MLARTCLRRYLNALLCSVDIPQTKDCDTGPLWTECDGTPIRPDDTPFYELDTDGPAGEPELKSGEVHVVYRVQSERMKLTATRECETTLVFEIHIHACDNEGWKREDILDILQERIITRLFAAPRVTDEEGIVYPSPFEIAKEEIDLTISDADGSLFEGIYAARILQFTLKTENCLGVPDCPAPVICFKCPPFPSLIPPKPSETDP